MSFIKIHESLKKKKICGLIKNNSLLFGDFIDAVWNAESSKSYIYGRYHISVPILPISAKCKAELESTLGQDQYRSVLLCIGPNMLLGTAQVILLSEDKSTAYTHCIV